MKGTPLTDARDLVVGKFIEVAEDHAIRIVCSVKVSDRPEITGVVRAEQHVQYV